MHRRPDLYTRWSHDMQRQSFFHAGQRVGVAVSGGPDSVLLLHFMHRLAGEVGLALAAVHFNHRLRGAESDGDEALVRGLADSLHIGYIRDEAEVARVARERRGNLEAVARDLRYRFFFRLVEQEQLDRVATAHTANDQAETVLMRLLRGTGTRGLGGIYPLLEGKVVRPFLEVTRHEIMQEVADRGLPFRIDSSNLNIQLRRNKIRAELLPLLAKEYNPEIVPLLNRFAERARDDEACLERWARDWANPWRVRDGEEERISTRALLELPTALVRRVLRQMVQAVLGTPSGLTHAHIEALRRFAARAQSGRSQTLPGGVVARKEFSWLVVGPGRPGMDNSGYSYPVTIPGEFSIPEIGLTLHFKILNHGDPGQGYNLHKPTGLDPQKLGGDLTLRNWRVGDRFCPVGCRRVRKLKELFLERKIPEVRRKGWPVLLSAGQLVWVRGFPPGRDVAATDDTARVLIVEEEPSRPSRAARKKPL